MSLPSDEIPEAGAPAEVAAVYKRLREATGVPVINQVVRRIAAIPGALDWYWGCVRDPLSDGTLSDFREEIATALASPGPALSEADWRAAEVPDGERDDVRSLVAVYNRGNLTNVLLLSALADRLSGRPRDPDRVLERVRHEEPAPLPVPPPLPSISDLPATTAAEVRALARRHGGTGVIPNLYLHLALWPEVPGALPRWLGSVLDPAEISASASRAAAVAQPWADSLDLRFTDPDAAAREALTALLAPFTGRLIPSMIGVGLALAARLDASPTH